MPRRPGRRFTSCTGTSVMPTGSTSIRRSRTCWDEANARLLRKQSLIRGVDYRQWVPAASRYIVHRGVNPREVKELSPRNQLAPGDERALIAINDLGPSGETWSLNTPSTSGGRLYHRSLNEGVAIGK